MIQEVFHLIDDDQFQIYSFISINLVQMAKEQYASRVVERAIEWMPPH